MKCILSLVVSLVITQAAFCQGPVAKYSMGMAGKVHPTTGIPYDVGGFPDFSKYVTRSVTIEATGIHATDFALANKAAGLKETPLGFTWHHHQDCRTMQLVPTGLHKGTPHIGGASIIRARNAGLLGMAGRVAGTAGKVVGKVAVPVAIVLTVAEIGIDIEQRFEDIVDAVTNPNLTELQGV